MKLKMIILCNLVVLLLGSGVIWGEDTAVRVHQDCSVCHKDVDKDPGALKADINQICLGCHEKSKRNDHPIGLVPAIKPKELPLDKEGKITCVTCHEPHGWKPYDKLLRMEFNSLCKACHKI